jgi:SulP family sulfate permease
VLSDFAARLAAVDGRLFLSGVSPELLGRMRSVGMLDGAEPIRAFAATSVLGASSRQAYEEAETWLIRHRADPPAERT